MHAYKHQGQIWIMPGQIWIQISRSNLDTNIKVIYEYKQQGQIWIQTSRLNKYSNIFKAEIF